MQWMLLNQFWLQMLAPMKKLKVLMVTTKVEFLNVSWSINCRFLVMDATVANLGAYYEAGYALGKGKEVIICCDNGEFKKDDKRPHFDIVQKSMIIPGPHRNIQSGEWICHDLSMSFN